MALNCVIIMGRLVRDPELRHTQNSGVACTSVRIAVERDNTEKGSGQTADFFSLVAWRNTAEFLAKYFKKGQQLVVKGRLRNQEWTDNSGKKHVETQIVVDNNGGIYFVDSKNGAPSSGVERKAQNKNYIPDLPLIDNDDPSLPF